MSKITSLVSTQEAQEILDKHNCARKRYALKPLVWNWELAANAQEHADRCIWEHASKIGLGVPGQGENLSLAMNRPVNVDGWLAEEKNYDCSSGRCTPATICGHWTQMAWANTGQVGCGKRRCSSLEKAPGFVNSDILVCRYTPPGNYVGQPMANSSQCESGATNKSCNSKTSAPTVSTQPKASIEKPLPAAKPEAKLEAVTIDKFQTERQRIAQLQQVNVVATPIYIPQTKKPNDIDKTEDYFANESNSLPSSVPVIADPNAATGYPTAEESIEAKKNFSRNIIIAISITILLVLAALLFFSYRYRVEIKNLYGEAKEKVEKKIFYNQ